MSSPALAEKPRSIGLFTSLPLLWPEAEGLSGMLRGDAPPHWARQVIARHGAIVPLDRLDASDKALAELRLIIMPQPRALAPAENVALDGWVRGGGHLLIFADPMLTQDSAFGLGDKRRPMDVANPAALFRHWGLAMTLDPKQSAGERIGRAFDISFPVNLAGLIVAVRGPKACRVINRGLAAACGIGKGRVIIVADAALFETRESDKGDLRSAGLDGLIALAATPVGSGATR